MFFLLLKFLQIFKLYLKLIPKILDLRKHVIMVL